MPGQVGLGNRAFRRCCDRHRNSARFEKIKQPLEPLVSSKATFRRTRRPRIAHRNRESDLSERSAELVSQSLLAGYSSSLNQPGVELFRYRMPTLHGGVLPGYFIKRFCIQHQAVHVENDCADLCQRLVLHVKLDASSVLPDSLYFATCEYWHRGMVRVQQCGPDSLLPKIARPWRRKSDRRCICGYCSAGGRSEFTFSSAELDSRIRTGSDNRRVPSAPQPGASGG